MQDGQQTDQQPADSSWVFRPGDQTAQSSVSAVQGDQENPGVAPLDASQFSSDEPHVEWTASEYIANPKSSGWFMLLAVASLLVAGLVFVITDDPVSAVVVAILGLMLGIFAARQPRVLRYAIDNTGLHIGEKFYPYGTFKSFSIADDQAMGYVYLMPLRRFMPPLSVHYDPTDEDKIVDTLGSYLPYEEHKRDMVDSLTKKFRF